MSSLQRVAWQGLKAHAGLKEQCRTGSLNGVDAEGMRLPQDLIHDAMRVCS